MTGAKQSAIERPKCHQSAKEGDSEQNDNGVNRGLSFFLM